MGELFALITACLWSGSSLAFASASKRVGSFYVNVTRLFLAATYLFILILLMRFDMNLSGSQLMYLCISGILGLAVGDTFLFKAYQLNGARITMLIMSLAPAIAASLAFFILAESISLTGITGITITIFGICVVVLEGGSDGSPRGKLSSTGIIYALLAAAGQGAGLVFAKVAFRESDINGFVATEIRILASIVPLVPFALLTKRYSHPYQTFIRDIPAFWQTVLGSILGPFLGITSSLLAIKYTDVGIAATIMAIVPILMLPLVKFIYKEKFTWRAIIGAFVAVAGVSVLFLR